MKNSLVAKILEELADYTELEDEQPYRARAYRRAAQTIEGIPEQIEEIAERKELTELSGIGENIEKKIVEILRTGKLKALEDIKKRLPVDLPSLKRVEGVGPKTILLLYEKLKVRNLDEFEAAVKSGKIERFPGLGLKSAERLLENISNARQRAGRVLLAEAIQISNRVVEQLKQIPHVERFAIAGSFRRRKETIGDFDVLIQTEEPASAIDLFTKKDEVKEVLSSGELKASVILQDRMQVDVRVISEESWGAALLYFTGSKEHNISLRTIAIQKGFKLNEYGLFDTSEKVVASRTEEEIYGALGMDYIEPELRESRGEIEAAQVHRLPTLVSRDDIKGDLQMHTTWSDGREDIRAMAEKAIALNYEYIAITDHIGSLKIANALDEGRITDQRKEIEKLNENFEKSETQFHILHGAEVNIKYDGRLDMPDRVLKDFDVVLASIHSGFSKSSTEKMTHRIVSSMENEKVDIIAHPTGRLLLERSSYSLDFSRVFQKASDTGTILEMDAHPNRLDLSDENAHEAIRAGLVLALDTDSHDSTELDYMEIGVWQARRAWARKGDILNTKNYKELAKSLSL